MAAIPDHSPLSLDQLELTERDSSDRPVSLLSLINVLLRRRWLVGSCAILGLVLAGEPKLFSSRTYTSTATFLPVSTRRASNLSGLAAQLGISSDIGEAGQSPQFYVELLSSREILRPVAESRFGVFKDGRPVSIDLVDWYGLADEPRAKAVEGAIRELRKRISATPSLKTGIVSLSAVDASPLMAQTLASRLLAQMARFNETRRYQSAAAEREFTATQLAESDAQLRAAENRLRSFLELNRQYTVSPTLSLEQERLQREVTMRQQLYTSTALAYQQVKVDELRNAPTISIIEPPEVPTTPNPRGLLKAMLLGAIVGLTLGSLFALLREYFANAQALTPHEGEEFRALKRALREELRAPFRAVRARIGRKRVG
jgi:uncharacterized protein involved in exopolysaccharide biosynthesis